MTALRTYGRAPYYLQKEDLARCIAEVYDDHQRCSFQCKNKRKQGPGGQYCKLHDPDVVKARDAARRRIREERWQRTPLAIARRRAEEAEAKVAELEKRVADLENELGCVRRGEWA